jgi:glyoxylase I family protein
MPVLHFSHSGICVSDLERSTAFDRDVFGFTRHHHLDLNGEANSTAGRVKDAEPDPIRETVPREKNRMGLTHFSFNIDEIAEVSRDGVAEGGRVMQEAQVGTPDDKSCVFVTDPQGYWIERIKSPADPNPTPTT